jgi:integrase
MPRPKNVLPQYRKHSSGQARVTINGRDHLLGPHGTKASKREYDRIIAEFLAGGRSSTFGAESDGFTIAVLMHEYLKFAKCYYGTGESSEWHRLKLAFRPLKALYATLPALDFGPAQFKSVRQQMIDNGLSRTGINANMKRIVRMFKWCAAEGQLPAAIHDTIRLIPGLKKGRTTARETDAVRPVSDDVVNATLEHLLPVVADMVRVQLLTGCRPGEVCLLTPSMFDRSQKVWTATLAEHKTAHHGHERTIYIGPKAQQILKPYLLRGPNERLFRPSDTARQRRERDHANRTTPLSCGNRPGTHRIRRKPKRTAGDFYITRSYGRAITRAAKKNGVNHWSPNQLRHTRGTLVRKMFGLDAAASILGHSEVGVTQVYAEQDRERAINVAKKIG